MSNIDLDALIDDTHALVARHARVAIITLGCAKNEVDTAEMLKRLHEAGYALAEDADQADVVIVNTCSFIQEATEESLATILELSGQEELQTQGRKIVVAGCMPARYGDELESELSEAAAFVPCSKEEDIVAVLDKLLKCDVSADGLNGADDTDGALDASSVACASLSADPAFSPYSISPAAYVKISDGCDRYCSFCAIPFIRGPYHSFSLEEITAGVEERIAAGVREITLIAQDTGRWGEDFSPQLTTAYLLDYLATRFPSTWFRLMYIEPVGISDELLEVIAARDNICKYLDLPLQHVCSHILADMNRQGSYEEHMALLRRIRNKVPSITLRTTFIVGFPGESEKDFEELLHFVEEAEFDYVGVFPFSPEEGTQAASLPFQVDEETKAERASELREVADAIGQARVAARIGQKMDILVLGYEEDAQLFGRAMCQAPDVDGVTFLQNARIGDIVSLQIEDTLLYEMEGA